MKTYIHTGTNRGIKEEEKKKRRNREEEKEEKEEEEEGKSSRLFGAFVPGADRKPRHFLLLRGLHVDYKRPALCVDDNPPPCGTIVPFTDAIVSRLYQAATSNMTTLFPEEEENPFDHMRVHATDVLCQPY